MPDPESQSLALARCAAIARRVLTDAGIEFTEEELTEMARDMRATADAFPPLTQEQIDKLRVLLRLARAERQQSTGGGAAQ